MVEVVNWILSGLVGLLIMILGYVLKMLITKFDEMIKSINNLTKTMALHAQRLEQGEKEFKTISDSIHDVNKNLATHIDNVDKRFDAVENRVLQIEIVHKVQEATDEKKN